MSSPLIHGSLPFTIETRYALRAAPGSAPAPLVLLLHGQGMKGQQLMRLAALPDAARRHLLAPDGPYPTERRRPEGIQLGHAWYVYDGDQAAFRRELEVSEGHVLRLLDQVSCEHPVDPQRVTLLGYSQGGYLAGFVALRHPDRFRGLVIASARLKHEFLENEIASARHPAVLFVHSQADSAVRWDSAAPGLDRLKTAGASVEIELHDEGHRIPADFGARVARWLDRHEL